MLTGGSLCQPGGGERSDWGDPVHHERAARLPHLLAHLQHHGGQPVCGQVRTLRQPHGLHLQRDGDQQQDPVPGHERHTVLLDQSQSQL